jgi:hypothetical protein
LWLALVSRLLQVLTPQVSPMTSYMSNPERDAVTLHILQMKPK